MGLATLEFTPPSPHPQLLLISQLLIATAISSLLFGCGAQQNESDIKGGKSTGGGTNIKVDQFAGTWSTASNPVIKSVRTTLISVGEMKKSWPEIFVGTVVKDTDDTKIVDAGFITLDASFNDKVTTYPFTVVKADSKDYKGMYFCIYNDDCLEVSLDKSNSLRIATDDFPEENDPNAFQILAKKS